MSFPNVPNLPGVPAIPRAAGGSVAAQAFIGLAASALVSLGESFFSPVWDIVDGNGVSLVKFDSMVNLSYNHEHKITDAPVELGQFASFNRVNTPAETKIKLTKSGSDAERYAFLTTLANAAGSTTLYTILMREGNVGMSYNLTTVSFVRSAESGISLISAILTFRQVMVTSVAYSTTQNAQNPASASPASSGNAQVSTPPTSLLQQGANAVKGVIGKLSL